MSALFTCASMMLRVLKPNKTYCRVIGGVGGFIHRISDVRKKSRAIASMHTASTIIWENTTAWFKLTNNIYHFPVNAGDDPMTFWFWYGCCGLSPFCVDDNVQGNVFSLHANAIIIIIFGCLPQIFVGIPLFGWTCFRNVKIATGLLRIHGVCGGSMKNLYRQIS